MVGLSDVLSSVQRGDEFVSRLVFVGFAGSSAFPVAYARFKCAHRRSDGVLRLRFDRPLMESFEPHQSRHRRERAVPMGPPSGVRYQKSRMVDWRDSRHLLRMGELEPRIRDTFTLGMDGNLLPTRAHRGTAPPHGRQRVCRIYEKGSVSVRSGNLVAVGSNEKPSRDMGGFFRILSLTSRPGRASTARRTE